MIPRIHKQGSRTLGLLSYLYGRGTHEEHVDPHLVASFDDLAPDPGRDPAAKKKDLQQLLDQPLALLEPDCRPAQHVWHCSVRAAPDDPVLSDEQWAQIARRMVAATGIDPGDGAGCRWAAVRHADDHIHIIATLVREDGRRPDHHRSGQRAQAEARLIEADYDLTRIAPGDGTAAKRATSAERHKASRAGRAVTAREELRDTVRHAAAGAASTDEFLNRLHDAGLLVRIRALPSGDLRGYTVALPGDRNKDREPVFYAGSTLAPDLSLPRIQERFALPTPTPDTSPAERAATGIRGHRSPAAEARRGATGHAWHALLTLQAQPEDPEAMAHIAATSDVLHALADTSGFHRNTPLHEAARTFERAARSHTRAEHHHAHRLRHAARTLIQAGPALNRGEDGASTAMLLDTLIFLTLAAAHWHAQRHHAQQAEAAHRTAQHLRTAYRTAAHSPLVHLHEHGRRLPPRLRQQQATAVREALPEYAGTLLDEPGWPALAAALTEAERAGRDPRQLLTEAAAHRELASAESLTHVLTWRIRRTAGLPASVPAPAPKVTRSAQHSPAPTPAVSYQPTSPRGRRR